MARAVRAVSVERGRDPRQHLLVAFGGNGPLHAVGLARSFGIPRIIIPPHPGLFSAVGLLCAERERHEVLAYRRRLADLDVEDLARRFRILEAAVRAAFPAQQQTAAVHLAGSVDMRYVGQSFELEIPIPESERDPVAFRDRLAAAFTLEHQRRYGHRAPDDPIEIVNLRVVGSLPRAGSRELGAVSRVSVSDSTVETTGVRQCYFGREFGTLTTAVRTRSSLKGVERGPLLIDEYDATILVPPGATALCDEWGNVVIEGGNG
jgi:N-methylhydantoinase A